MGVCGRSGHSLALRQRNVSTSFAKLADVQKQSGDRVKARDYLRQGQAILARLTTLSPGNAEWKRDPAWFDEQIAALGEK